MNIKQVYITRDTLLDLLISGKVYLVRDNRNHSGKSCNSGRLTMRQLKYADIDELIGQIERGEEINAIQIGD